MPRIALSKDFIDRLLSLDASQYASVLQACRQLLDLDDAAIEALQLAPGTPELVADLHAELKRRVQAARRRRERREAKAAREAAAAAESQVNATEERSASAAKPQLSGYSVADYHRVVETLLSGKPSLTGSQYVLIIKLARLILKRISPDTKRRPRPRRQSFVKSSSR